MSNHHGRRTLNKGIRKACSVKSRNIFLAHYRKTRLKLFEAKVRMHTFSLRDEAEIPTETEDDNCGARHAADVARYSDWLSLELSDPKQHSRFAEPHGIIMVRKLLAAPGHQLPPLTVFLSANAPGALLYYWSPRRASTPHKVFILS
jgi:hypothetical protein